MGNQPGGGGGGGNRSNKNQQQQQQQQPELSFEEKTELVLKQNESKVERLKVRVREEELEIKRLSALAKKQVSENQNSKAEKTLNVVYDLEQSVKRKKQYIRQLQELRQNYNENLEQLGIVEQQRAMLKLLDRQRSILENSRDLTYDIADQKEILDALTGGSTNNRDDFDFEKEERMKKRKERLMNENVEESEISILEKRLRKLKMPTDSNNNNNTGGGGGGGYPPIIKKDEKKLDSQVEDLIRELNED